MSERSGGSYPSPGSYKRAHQRAHERANERAEDALLGLPQPPRGIWNRPGLTRRAERAMDVAGAAVIALLLSGWAWSLATARPAGAENVSRAGIGSAITAVVGDRDGTSTAYLTDAALRTFVETAFAGERGASGRLRASFQVGADTLHADTLPPGADIQYAPAADSLRAGDRPTAPGVWRVVLAVGKALRPVADFSVISMVPFSEKKAGRVGSYMIGSWPSERGAKGPPRAPADRYANPRGFIEVTAENQNTYISEHFRLRDFLTKNQWNVWPKYLVLHPRLIDKMELVLAELRTLGIDTKGVKVMSGFRTPSYNAGGGNTSGRADLSRHMYGDAADIYIDNDGNGNMDDLDRDGRVTIDDSRFILKAVDRVEAKHPDLIGGTGVYRASAGHGPFIHIDTRGYRARW
jgi:uncharacterized protein YcbK (DUF882 family)